MTNDLGIPFTLASLLITYPLAVMDIKRQLRCHKMNETNKYQWFLRCKPKVTCHMGRDGIKWSAWVVCIADGVEYTSGTVAFNFSGMQPSRCGNWAEPKKLKNVRAEVLIEEVF